MPHTLHGRTPKILRRSISKLLLELMDSARRIGHVAAADANPVSLTA